MKKSKPFPQTVLYLLLTAVLASALCLSALAARDDPGGSSGSGSSATISDLAVSLEPAGPIVLASGVRHEVKATATYTVTPAGAVVTPKYCWNVQPADVLTLSGEDGDAVALDPTSTPGNAILTVTVTVKDADGRMLKSERSCKVLSPGVILQQPSASVDVRSTVTLNAKVFLASGLANTDVTWTSDDPAVAEVSSVSTPVGGTTSSAVVRGLAPGTTVITLRAGDDYTAECHITVEDVDIPDITWSGASADSPLRFSSISSNIASLCSRAGLSSLYYVTSLQVPTDAGTLYYGYQSESEPGSGVATTENYYYSSGRGSLLNEVTFVPQAKFSGTATIRYTAFDQKGESFQGAVKVGVNAVTEIQYSTVGRGRVDFVTGDFSNICKSRTGFELDYVTFDLPSASKGTLFFGYSGSDLDNKVSSTTPYYRAKTPRLSDVTFVAAEGYSGTVTLNYDGRSITGRSFSGTVSIVVTSGGSHGSGNISYTTRKNRAVRFDVDDFNNYCRNETDSSLNYVTFTLPSSTRGTLYYNYSSSSNYGHKVSAGTRYNRNSSYYLDSVSFVPADGWTGTADISFTGYSNGGTRFSGTVTVEVERTGSGSLSYTTRRNTAVAFDRDDFDDYCEDRTGRHLNCIRFDLPSSSRGTLRYNYNSSSSTGSSVSSSTNYYRSQSPYLDNVSFVPASGWSGTADIGFTGWDTGGERFTGTVEVTVKDGGTASGSIAYSTAEGTALDFKMDDFDDLCDDKTGKRLNYVRFTLPAASRGTLYYNYSSPSSTGSKASASTSYYRSSSPYLNNITFVPAGGYTGTVAIDFTGYNTGGERFTGTVSVTVKAASSAGIIYYATAPGKAVAFQTASFQTACSARGAGSFVSASFTPPSAAAGQLRQGYASASSPGVAVNASQTYRATGSPLVSEVTFVPAAGYTGAVTISYTGKDSQNKTYTGQVIVTVSGTAASSFTDMGNYAWASPAVEALYSSGVVSGTGSGKFSPGAPITRGSFMLMLCRAFHFTASGGAGFSDVPAGSVYAAAVRTAQALGIAQGSNGQFSPKSPLSRQQAAVFLTRALRCYGWTVTDGTRSDLGGFADSGAVSDYAVGSLAAMVRMGIFQGDSSGRLNPAGQLTRAQMAVILYRAVTL